MSKLERILFYIGWVLLTVGLGCASINTILDDPETEKIMHFTNVMMMPLN
jgi:hypothetical protein